MDTLLCNRCGHCKKFSPDERVYLVSSCGHIFCQHCGERMETCPLCNTNTKCRLVEISPQATPDVQAYFKEPMALLQQLVSVMTFQKNQSKIFMQLVKKLFDNQNSAKSLQARCDRLEKENQELTNRLQAAENRERERERERQAAAAAAAAAKVRRVSPTIISSTPGVQPFIQQAMDPTFQALFGDTHGLDNRNEQFGITPHPHIGELITPPSEPRDAPSSAENCDREAAVRRRLPPPQTPIQRRLPAFQPRVPATPRGHGFNPHQNNIPQSAGGDIMSRLQRLRW